ncbi:hypothetical protein QF117_09165 [Vibrio sp. YMD68]|uniref:hypothetical protein n=1 Tax=Vibrio sp. YMD68 TaxID=3042300 RepID=UPI002499DBFF|nr:hypothetical protein [Vibrio sp. YMD68]WGW00348.1 hypothetical protein QF117_21210 [Vibrio sp. YMD68]WGW00971.1 hypothetical protein QF117_09165 [Vibrio sp. YMD68]
MEIKVIAYSRQIAALFASALGDYSEDILRNIKCGLAQIWQIEQTHFVVMVESDSKGKVLVVLCAVGEGLANTAPRVLEQANNIGAYGCRFHTTHKGLHRLINLPVQWVENVFLVPVEGCNGK